VSAAAWAFVLAAFFAGLGIGFVLWGRRERVDLDNALAQKEDLREFLTHNPESPQPGALITGGRIALVIAAALVITGVILL